jgi:nitrilase
MEVGLRPVLQLIPETLPFVPEYYANAVENNGPEAEALKAAARKYKIRVIIGVAEKDHGSLYMTQWIISPDGGLVARRKVKPTGPERIVFGDGDVSTDTRGIADL